jgi:FPC/CPF motif-containing protein YcgG
MMLTFQPRWVFQNILGSQRAAELAFAKVRSRLAAYDLLPPAPALGRYGDPANREFRQYFLDESDGLAQCPFHSLTQPQKEKAA